MRAPRGFVLMEWLIAASLAAFVAMAVSAGFLAAVKAAGGAQENFARYRPFRKALAVFEEDVRNAVFFSGLPFQGKAEEVEFLSYRLPAGRGERRLLHVSYKPGPGCLRREEKELTQRLKEKTQVRVAASALKRIRFEYAYRDGEGRLVFLPVWHSARAGGLPAAVRVTLEAEGRKDPVSFHRLFVLPHGRIASVPGGPRETGAGR